MKIRLIEYLLFPLLLTVFFITYHYYEFYQDDFTKIFQYVPLSLSVDQYEDIQRHHPYYPIQNAIESTLCSGNKVYYIQTLRDPKNKIFLKELTIMINYYAYPEKIRGLTMKEFVRQEIPQGSVVISDVDVSKDIVMNKNMSYRPYQPSEFARINRRMEYEQIFYLYNVM